MTSWRWIGEDLIYAVHDRQLAEHGGPDGVRDRGAVDAAFAEPRNLVAASDPDAADLAASYAYGPACNRGFADGNKRTAWVIARLFLADNGYHLSFNPMDAVKTMEALAGGALEESELAQWFRQRMAKP